MGPIKNNVPPEKMKRLAAELLDLASEKFSNHGCNDLGRPDYFTEAEWRQMAVDFEQWNSSGEDSSGPLGDSQAMSWLATLLDEGIL